MKAIKFLATIAILFFSLQVVATGDPILATAAVTLAFAFIGGMYLPNTEFNTLNAGVNVEVWKKYLVEKLRKTNEFLFKSKDDSSSVLGGAVVWIPQAGADPAVQVNSTSYPAVAVIRADEDVNYVLDSFRTVPTHIPWASIQDISYDKIDSVLGGHGAAIAEAIADSMLIKWSPAAANLIKTTGDAIAPITGQTGNRKGFDPKDLKKAMVRFNTQNIPKKGRVCMIEDNMYEYFYDSLSDKFMNAFNQFANNETGVVGRLHSFDIMTRSSVLQYASADTVKALGSALAATDNLASLCWHPDTVCRAVGETKQFQDKDNPLYYGDIYSVIARAGGRKERKDEKGVIAIVQDAAA